MPASEEDVTDSKLKLLKEQLGRINPDHFIISRNKDEYPAKEADSHNVILNHSKEKLIYHETSHKLPTTKITNVMDNRDGFEKNMKPECRKEQLREKMPKDRDWENNGVTKIIGEIVKLEPHTAKYCLNSLKKYLDLAEADGSGYRSFTCGSREKLTSKLNEKVSCNAQEEIDDNSLGIDTDNTEEQNDEATAVKKLFAFQSGAAVDNDVIGGEEEEEDEQTLKYITDMMEAENDKAADMKEIENDKSNNEGEGEDNKMHSNDVQEKQESEKSEKSFTKLIDYYLDEVPMSLESLLQPFSISNNVSFSFIPSEEPIYEKEYKPPLTVSMDSLAYFGENRLSLELLKPRNVCYPGNIYASRQSNMSDSFEAVLLYAAESKVCNLAYQNPSLDFNVLTYSSWRKCNSKRFLGKNWAYELFRDSDSKFSSFGLKNEDSISMEKFAYRLNFQKLEEPEVEILSSCSEIHESKNFKDNDIEDSEKMSDSTDRVNWISNNSFSEKDLEMSYIYEKEGEDVEEFSWCEEHDYMEEKTSLDMYMEEECYSNEYISEKCNEGGDSETALSLDYWCCLLQKVAVSGDFEEGKDPSSSNNSTALSERETGCENGRRFVFGEDEMPVKEMNAPESIEIHEDVQKLQVPESRHNDEKEGGQSEESVLVPHRNKDRKNELYEFDWNQKNGDNFQENCQRMRLQREFFKRKHNRRKMAGKKLRRSKEHKEKTNVFKGKIKRNMSKEKQRNPRKFMKQKMVNRRVWLRFDEDGTSPQRIKTMKGFFLPLFGGVQIRLPLVAARIRCRSGGESNQGRSSGHERSDRGASNNGEQGNGSASSGRGNGREGGSGASGGAGGDDNRKNLGNGNQNINNSNDPAHQDLKNELYSKKVIDCDEETHNVTKQGSNDKKPLRSEQTASSPSSPPPRLDPEHGPQRKIAEATRSWIPNSASFPTEPTLPSSSNNQGYPPSDHLSGFSAAEDTYEEEVASGVQHATLSIDQLCFIIGDATRGPPSNMHTFMNMNQCLTHLIHNLNIAANEDSKDASYDSCIICQILSQLLIHMADPEHEGFAKSCDQCAQIFNLIMLHCTVCIEADRQKTRFTQSDLCCKICKFSNWKVEMLSLNLQRLQSKVQKYCDKVLGSTAEPLTIRYLDGAAPMGIGEMEVSALSDMPSTGLSSPSSKNSTSLTISGNIVTTETGEPEQVHPDEVKHPSRVSNTPLVQPTMAASTGAVPAASGSEPTTHSKLMRKPSQRKPLDIPPSIKEENNQDQGRKDDIENLIYQRYYGTRDDPYETQKTYGEQNHYGSLPLRNVHDVEQFLSVSTRPQGAPGVGEVVFGHPSLLKLVASFWDKKREECERTQTCPYQHREEGVILAEHKGNFCILHTRYQKHHQWERVSHLGNGMSGKCHLAIDMKTNFKFCCKKIHLLKYAEEELTLWTEFNNRYVVRLYGAIRHGVKIYIFSEFFDGGSLAACIEEQKRLGRRLSHWSAINYFQQILKVLDFLQKKNVLHEDIKADNILLRRNSTFLAVTDFGTSRRLQDPKELKNKSPVGSPTHWSPEKASMEGHGFPSDLWAAICVLVHMLSGEPPWVKRFLQRAGMLNYIIYARPPPMEDVPNNVQLVVRDLIERGFNKDPKLRPSSSDLLNHQAFSILDKGTPETYFSTLASVAQSGFHAARIAVGSNEQQDVKREAPSSQAVEAVPADAAVLFEGEVSTGPYQESDSRPDHRNLEAETLPQAVRCKEQTIGVEQRNDTSATNESKGAENDVAKYGGNNSSTGPGIDINSRAAENDSLLVENNEAIKTNERVSQLMAFDIDKLLPQFDELFSGDSINNHSIKSFFIDNYNTEVLNGTRKSALKEYRPGERSEELPNLSIFNASWGTESAMKEEQENAESVNQLLATQTDASATAGVKSSLRNRFLRSKSPSESPVQFQLSSGSDDCTSAELFEPGPGNKSPHASQGDADNQAEDEHFTTATETLSSLNFNQGDVSPTASTGSTLSSSGTTSLQQRKPVNLRLDVNCTTPTAKLLHSQSEIKASSSASTSELENKHRSHTWSQISSSSSSHQGGSTPSSSHAFSTLRKTSGASGSSTASSNHSQFSYRPNSIKEEQDRVFQELAEMLDAYSSSGSDGLLDYQHEDIINDEKIEQEETTDFQTLMHKEIDESKLVGENLKFYNDKGEHLFTMWIEEMPNSWSRLIPRVAQKIVKLGYKHFSIHNIDGFPADLHQALSDHEFKVVELGEPGKYCWCQYCEMRF